jgi:hypothetical protein
VTPKSPGRKRADAEFDRLWRPAPVAGTTEPEPPAETRPEKTERLKALRLEAERKSTERS